MKNATSTMRPSRLQMFFILLSVCPALFADESDESTKNAMVLLESGHADSALIIFEKIHTHKPFHYPTLYGLALTYADLDSPITKAVQLLDLVGNQRPGQITDLFKVACIYEKAQRFSKAYDYYKEAVRKKIHFPHAQLGLARMLETIDFPSGKAVDLLGQTLLKNSDNDTLYQLFISSAIRNLQENKAVTILEKIPNSSVDRQLDLAEFYLLKMDHTRALQVLDALKDKCTDRHACRFFNLEAKIAYDCQQDTLGVRNYWQAVAVARDSIDIQLLKDDLYYILKENELTAFAKMKKDGLSEFLTRFWQSRDPDLSTKENERIPEHFRRLFLAQRIFRRYKNPQELGITSRHRALDDAGMIYVKHGPPDLKVEVDSKDLGIVASDGIQQQINSRLLVKTATINTGAPIPTMHRIERNSSWKYEAFFNRSAMVFHFEHNKLRGRGWELKLLPENFQDRWVLGGAYVRMEALFNSPSGGRPGQTELEEMTHIIQEQSRENIELGKSTETSSAKSFDTKFDCLLTVKSFKGTNGKNLVELYYLLQGKDIVLDHPDDPVLRLKLFAAFYNSQWQELLKKDMEKIIDLPVSATQWKHGSAVLVERFMLPVDFIHFEFSMTNAMNQDMGICKGTFQLDDFGGNELKMSDILLSAPIDTSSRQSVFRKGRLSYSPHMFLPFRPGEIIGLYFELYNLHLNSNNAGRYQVTCYLKAINEKTGLISMHQAVQFVNLMGQLTGNTQSSYIKDGNNKNEAIFLNVDIGKAKRGRYELVIVAQDFNGGEVAKSVELFIK